MDSSAFKNKGLGGLIYEGVSEEPFRVSNICNLLDFNFEKFLVNKFR